MVFEGPLAPDGSRVVTNRDDRLFRNSLVPGKGSVYVLTLVSRPADEGAAVPAPDEFLRPETRAVTVAIHLNVGPNSSVAVDGAEEILPILAPLLR